jgi:hypothetical protein
LKRRERKKTEKEKEKIENKKRKTFASPTILAACSLSSPLLGPSAFLTVAHSAQTQPTEPTSVVVFFLLHVRASRDAVALPSTERSHLTFSLSSIKHASQP